MPALFSKDMNKIVLLLIVVGLLVVGGWFALQQQTQPTSLPQVEEQTQIPTPAQIPSSTAPPEESVPIVEDETADWKVYRNEKYGYEIKYPDNESCGGGELGVSPEEQFSCYVSIGGGAGVNFLIRHVKADDNGIINYSGPSGISLHSSSTNALKILSEILKEQGYALLPEERIGGVETTRLIKEKDIGNNHQYNEFRYAVNNRVLYEIGYSFYGSSERVGEYKSGLSIFDRILSTFKFIGQ